MDTTRKQHLSDDALGDILAASAAQRAEYLGCKFDDHQMAYRPTVAAAKEPYPPNTATATIDPDSMARAGDAMEQAAAAWNMKQHGATFTHQDRMDASSRHFRDISQITVHNTSR